MFRYYLPGFEFTLVIAFLIFFNLALNGEININA